MSQSTDHVHHGEVCYLEDNTLETAYLYTKFYDSSLSCSRDNDYGPKI